MLVFPPKILLSILIIMEFIVGVVVASFNAAFNPWLFIAVFAIFLVIDIVIYRKYKQWTEKKRTELANLKEKEEAEQVKRAEQRKSATGTYPKLGKAEMLSNGELRLEFENGEIRYLDAELRQTILNGQHFVTGMVVIATTGWLGNEIVIADDGSLTINGKEKYNAEELYTCSTEHMKV